MAVTPVVNDPHDIYQPDLLIRILNKLKISKSYVTIYLVFLVIGVIKDWGFGSIVSYTGLYNESQLIRTFDPLNALWSVMVHLFFIPTIACIYVWQTRTHKKTLDDLKRNDVYVDANDEGLAKHLTQIKHEANSFWFHALAFIGGLTFVLLQVFFVYPSECVVFGKCIFYYQDKTYLWLAQVPYVLMAFYLVAVVAFRALHFVNWMNGMFSRVKFRIRPLFPDGAGGLGPIGALTMWYLRGASIFGLIWTGLSIYRSLTLKDPGVDLFMALPVYVTFVIYIMASLRRSAHRFMVSERDGLLQKLSDRYDRELIQSIEEPNIANKKKLKNIRTTAQFVREDYPVWPVRFVWFRGIGFVTVFTTILTLVITVISFLREINK